MSRGADKSGAGGWKRGQKAFDKRRERGKAQKRLGTPRTRFEAGKS